MLDAITGIADAKAEAPTSKPADFSKVRRVNSAKTIVDEFIWDCRLAEAKPSNRCATIREPKHFLPVRDSKGLRTVRRCGPVPARRDGSAERWRGRRRPDEVAGCLSGPASAGACTAGSITIPRGRSAKCLADARPATNVTPNQDPFDPSG
jgi:hypothetical protein